jgi:hypothetical protein
MYRSAKNDHDALSSLIGSFEGLASEPDVRIA